LWEAGEGGGALAGGAGSGQTARLIGCLALDQRRRRRPTRALSHGAGDYWGWFGGRSYHHTGPISTFYAMREALMLIGEEGLEPMWQRHQDMHDMLWDGLHKLGLQSFVEKDEDRWEGLGLGGGSAQPGPAVLRAEG